MQLLYLFLIAILNSIDNLGVGIAYGIAGIKVKFSKNLLIAFLAFAVSFIASLTLSKFIIYSSLYLTTSNLSIL
ncbi:hypothetical protein CCS79_06740 [Clostridium diolis]|uniref:hypothetical protein n=1 Tax=Clostridium TaxID=1485 RepID=UPI000B3F7939|nr:MULTISPECIES: hypothetical protein [Clostridium]NOW92746.1 putative Mn2+ efflux pump MntP [Clostridium beijerinckii]OVE69650.1 hypothetical protein CCS79_06740 [Clostridium diolis]